MEGGIVDDRSYRIAQMVLGTAIIGILLDATMSGFVVPDGLWAVLGAIAAFLGAKGALTR